MPGTPQRSRPGTVGDEAEAWADARDAAANGMEIGRVGIWAFFDPETMQARLRTSHGPGEPYEYVSGIIGAGGDIVEHELGFRAQYAKVLAIFTDEWLTPKEEIASMYHCPVLALSDYDAFCTEHGLIRLDKQ